MELGIDIKKYGYWLFKFKPACEGKSFWDQL